MTIARRLLLLLILTVVLAAGLMTFARLLRAEGELVRALQSRKDFLADSEKKKTRANWLALVKEFEDAGLAQDEPRHASRARYLGADLALESGRKFKQEVDFKKAGELARRSVRDCPRCVHAAAAQLVFGQALAAQGQLDQADKQLMKVELNYPDSPEVAEARKLLAGLRGNSPPAPETGKSRNAAGQTAASAPAGTKNPDQPAKTDNGPGGTSGSGQNESGQAKPQIATPPAEVKTPSPPKIRADGQAQVYFLTLADHGQYTTVTAYVDKVTPYVYNLIPPSASGGTFRAYADLKGAVLAPGTRLQLPEKTKLVRLVKMNQFKNDVVRLVLDMPDAHPYRPVFLDKPPRLVFQVAGEAGHLPAQGVEAQPEPSEKTAGSIKRVEPPRSTRPAAKGPADSMARQLGLKVHTVVIDPGHGGKDGGAAGYGLKEKDIVLKLSRKLAASIEKRLGLNVYQTREDDRFITLERRTKIAKDKKADLFISLHVNANNVASVQGFETYVLNFATDRSAMAVAARENASSDKSVAELEDILHIIAKNTKIAESRAMAQSLHKAALTAINRKYKVRDLGVKEAPFYVLVGSNIPSILVEIGFLTNENDAARLRDYAYLDLIAEGIVDGLESYVKGF